MNDQDLSELENAVNNQAQMQTKMIHLIETDFHLIRKNQEALNNLTILHNRILSIVEEIDADIDTITLYLILDETVSIVTHALETYIRIAEAASLHRLSFGNFNKFFLP